VVFSVTPAQRLDLYNTANWLFLFCAVGYFFADLSRVAYPTALLNEVHGSNASNGVYLFFALLYVLDCTLYFLVYNQWESEAIEEAAREKHLRGEDPDELDGDGDDHTPFAAPAESKEDEEILNGNDSNAPSDGVAHRRPHSSPSSTSSPSQPSSARSGDFAKRLMKESGLVARKARWCFFSHEGGMVNVMEIIAALIFATDATMTFFAGIAQVETVIQRRWDSATMTGDTIASFIFLCDSIVFQHIYSRTLETKARERAREKERNGGRTVRGSKWAVRVDEVPCMQPQDPYFWTSILNVVGSTIYFAAALWGVLRQNHISGLDNITPGSYNKNMLPMLQTLHAFYLSGDVF
jgi:hypothetical protein